MSVVIAFIPKKYTYNSPKFFKIFFSTRGNRCLNLRYCKLKKKKLACVGCCCMLKKDKYEDDEVTCSDSKDACMFWWCEP